MRKIKLTKTENKILKLLRENYQIKVSDSYHKNSFNSLNFKGLIRFIYINGCEYAELTSKKKIDLSEKEAICTRCLSYKILERCRINRRRPLTYKDECMETNNRRNENPTNLELRDKIFSFLFELKRGQKVWIKNEEQLLICQEFVALHGYDENIDISSNNKSVYKHKFLTKDFKHE